VFIMHEGDPGSGKSYDSVCKIIDNLRLGRKVYTNIDGLDDEVCRENIKCVSGLNDYDMKTRLIYLDESTCWDFWKRVDDGSLIVLDEAHKYFGSREWTTDANKQFVIWLTEHRHRGFDIVMMSMDIDRIDKQARQCAAWTYRYRKLNMFGKLLSNNYMVRAFIGDDSSGKPVQQMTRKFNKKIFGCYKSFVTKDMKELGLGRAVNALRHPVFYAIPLLLIVCVVLFFRSGFHSGDIFGAKEFQEKHLSKVIGSISDKGEVIKNGQGEKGNIESVKSGVIDVSGIGKSEDGKTKERIIGNTGDQFDFKQGAGGIGRIQESVKAERKKVGFVNGKEIFVLGDSRRYVVGGLRVNSN
jgi:hypothetical protein